MTAAEMERSPADVGDGRPQGERITTSRAWQSRRAHSGRAGELAQAIADVQLAGARAEFGQYVEIEGGYDSNDAFRTIVDRDQPEIARSIRNGRLAASFLERLSVWRLEAGE